MSEGETNEAAVEAPGGGSPLLLVAGAALLALGIGAGGVWFLLKPGADAAAAASGAPASAEAPDATPRSDGEAFRGRLFSMEPFVVNVAGDGYGRYLKVKMDLEASAPQVVEELEVRLPQVRDAVIVLLSSKRLSDIADFEGKALLKEDLRTRVNDLLARGEVRSVLFTEFVVQ